MSHNPNVPDEPGQLDLIRDQIKPDGWENNSIQFPRLLAELQSTGALTPNVIITVAEEMDVAPEYVEELIDRACNEWDNIKIQTGPQS